MKNILLKIWLILIVFSSFSIAQPKRPDAIWGRQVPPGTITLDGTLNEAAWAKADSVILKWGGNAGDPGSGYVHEGGQAVPSDPIDATLKFLVSTDGKLLIGVYAKDKSVGGGPWAQFDAMLFNMRDKKWRDANTTIATPYEYFYGWVAEGWADPTINVGNKHPGFFGWSGGHRDSIATHDRDKGAKNKDIWDAKTTVVGGEANNDSTGGADVAWVTEFSLDLPRRGYDVTKTEGDIIMFSLALWDSDYRWPLDTSKVGSARVFVQGPWGNASAHSHLRIFTKPSVTTSTTSPGDFPYDLTIENGENYNSPTIDGKLNEKVWIDAKGFNIRFGDNAVRNSYKNTIPFRSGQYQPDVLGKKESIVDPADANVKMFFKGDMLYVGLKVNDKNVQYHPAFDRQDGFRFMPKSRTERGGDKDLLSREITVRIDSSASKFALEGYGPVIVSDTIANNGSKIAVSLNTGTTVDTIGAQVDAGYEIEMQFNLKALGYSNGRSDGIFWFGGLLLDGDFGASSAVPAYGNRVWIGQEGTWPDGPVCSYMDPNVLVTTSVKPTDGIAPEKFELYGAYPNPFNPSTNIEFSVPQFSNVRIKIFDVLGRIVSSKDIYGLTLGRHAYRFDATGLTTGSYIYQVEMLDVKSNQIVNSKVGKMILMK